MFEDLQNAVEFDRDQILTQDTIDSLEDYASAGLQGINYTEYIIQTRATISNLSVNALYNDLQSLRQTFDMAGEVSDKLLSFI